MGLHEVIYPFEFDIHVKCFLWSEINRSVDVVKRTLFHLFALLIGSTSRFVFGVIKRLIHLIEKRRDASRLDWRRGTPIIQLAQLDDVEKPSQIVVFQLLTFAVIFLP